MGCPGKKQPQPCQLSLRGKKEQGSFSLLSSLSPCLQLLVGLERLQYLGRGGRGMRERQFWDPSPSKLGGRGEAICQRDFQCHRKELWLIRMRSLHPEKKICAGCKNADVCRGPVEIKKKKKKSASSAMQDLRSFGAMRKCGSCSLISFACNPANLLSA